MTRAYRAELAKIARRRVLLPALLVSVLAAVGAAALVLTSSEPAGPGAAGGMPTPAELAEAGGGTEVFRAATSFAGFFVFVVFLAAVAVEFSRGTFRTMLLHQPGRVRLLGGAMAARLTFAAGVLALTEALTWLTAWLLAPGQDVDTGAWTGLDAAQAAVVDYGAVLFWVTGYATLGMLLAVVVRSLPVALGVGIAWAGPFEHLLADAWDPALRFFPGLLLEAFAAGGTPDVSAGRALATVSAYTAVAGLAAAVLVRRRDVTA